jgi:heptosyltransferase I
MQNLTEIVARRIAVVKPSALGDIVHALPVLGALKARFPDSRISWIVNKSYQSLIDGHPYLEETIPFDRGALKGGIRKIVGVSMAFARELRKRRFDLTIDLQGLARSGLMTLATGARRRVGLGTAREGARFAYTDVIATPEAERQHAIDRYWLLAETFGVAEVPKQFRLPIPESANLWAIEELRTLPRPWMAFGVGARWLTKRWLPDHFAALAKMAHAKYGGSVYFIGTPDEAHLAQQVADQLLCPTRNYCGKTSLPQLSALLSHADVMVANDTGPLHLGVALGRRCVAPYTCTKAIKHGPYAQSGGIETTVWCKGSYLKTCDRLECMTDLRPERLWPALDEILRTWASTTPSP